MTARPARPFGFPRQARLKRRRLIRPLFDRTRKDVGTVAAGCIRLLYRVVPRSLAGCTGSVQVGFAVVRRRSSVERNRARRALREAYRLHQHILRRAFESPSEVLTVMLILRGRTRDRIGTDVPHALCLLAARLAENGGRTVGGS